MRFSDKDPIGIKNMIVSIKDIIPSNLYYQLSSYLNQIKQDYISARFLLILSQFKELNLDFVDKRVSIIDTLDYCIHNIYIQLVKTAFKGFFDILDKIASFINLYLKIGMKEKDVKFKNIWYVDIKNKKIHERIIEIKNFSLNAIYDIHQEFEKNGRYYKLRATRNALTHRFVNIRIKQKKQDEKNMDEDTLLKQTIDLAKIVRNSIIYLMQFVYVGETKKENEAGKKLPQILSFKIPDDSKNFR